MGKRLVCARCKREPEGFAMINNERFCHSENRHCYSDELWDLSREMDNSYNLRKLLDSSMNKKESDGEIPDASRRTERLR